jgi:uncharacterized membrane protein YidH (DUF202 family)
VSGPPDSESRDPESRDPEDRDPGLARERTVLAWTRTALSFGAVGGVIVKSDVLPGLVIMAAAPVVWQLGRLTRNDPPPARIRLITATVVAVSLAALAVAVFGHSTPLIVR